MKAHLHVLCKLNQTERGGRVREMDIFEERIEERVVGVSTMILMPILRVFRG